MPVNFGAGQFFKQLGAGTGIGIQKGRKATLGQQHGHGETVKVEAGQLFCQLHFFIELAAQNGAIKASQFGLGRLQFAISLVTGPTLLPKRPVSLAFNLKLHFRQGLTGVVGHQLITGLRHFAHARCLVIERQADGIKQGGLASAGGTNNGKQATVGKRRLAKVDFPFAFQ